MGAALTGWEIVSTWCDENSTGRWYRYIYQEIASGDRLNLNLRKESFEERTNLRESDALTKHEELRAMLAGTGQRLK